MITLFLIEKKLLQDSSFVYLLPLEKNRIEYYDQMSEVRSKDNYEQWIKFFLRAVKESAEDASDTIM